MLTNCTGAAAGVFNNIRIPAMLLAGAALGQIWAQFGDTSGEQKSFTLLVRTPPPPPARAGRHGVPDLTSRR